MKKLVSIVISIMLALASMSMLLVGVGCSHTHSFSSDYKSDQTSHWKECSCGEKADVEKHKDSDNNNTCDVCNYQMPVKSSTFDEDNIAFSFGAVSDVHVKKTMWESNVAQIYAAFDQISAEARKKDADGIDALAIVGDFISNTEKTDAIAEEEINGFVNILNDYADKDIGKNVLLTLGNHDMRAEVSKLPSLYNLLGADYFAHDIEMDLEKGYRHCVIGGYNFLLVQPKSYSATAGTKFDNSVLTWLDNKLATLTQQNPDEYVFVFTHPQISETTYGSEKDFDGTSTYWATENVRPVLEKYPQVISFSGHIHSPIADERCIMQTGFTAVNDGGVTSVAVEPKDYSNTSGSAPTGSDDCSSGILVQIDTNGNLRLTRMNFKDGETFKTPWELPYPKADKSHLNLYTREGRTASNTAPVLSGEITTQITTDGSMAQLSFAAGTDDDFVHHYVVKVEDASGNVTTEVKLLTDFYWWSNPKEQMAKTFDYAIRLTKGANKVTITAIDSWDAVSNELTTTITSANAPETLVKEFVVLDADSLDVGKITSDVDLTQNYLSYNAEYIGKVSGSIGTVQVMQNDDANNPYKFVRITSTGTSGKYAGITVGLIGTFKAESFNVTIVMRVADDFVAQEGQTNDIAFRLRSKSVTQPIYTMYKEAEATADADGFRTINFNIDGNGGAVSFWIFTYSNKSNIDIKSVRMSANA